MPVRPGGVPAAPAGNPLGTAIGGAVGNAVSSALGGGQTGGPAAGPVHAPAGPVTKPGPPGPGGAAGGVKPPAAAAGSSALVSFKLKYVSKEEQKHVSLELDRSEAVQRVYAPQGFFSELAGTLSGPTHFLDVDLDDPFFRVFSVDVQCGVDFAALGLVSINVALSYGRDDDPGGPKTTDLIFDQAHTGTQKFEAFLNAALDMDYRYRIEYNFAAGGPWHAQDISYTFSGETDDRTLELDPSRRLGFLEVTVEPTDIDPESLSFTEVQLRYADPGGWEQHSSLVVKADSPAQTWRVRTPDRAHQEFTYHFVHTLPDGSVVTTDPVTTTSTRVAVVDPFAARLDISVAPAWDPTKVRSVLIDLDYDDPDTAYHRALRLEFAGADVATRNVHIAIHDPALRTFRHRATIVGLDGQVRQTDYVPTTDTLIPIT